MSGPVSEAPRNNVDFLGEQMTPEQLAKARELSAKLEAEMADLKNKP